MRLQWQASSMTPRPSARASTCVGYGPNCSGSSGSDHIHADRIALLLARTAHLTIGHFGSLRSPASPRLPFRRTSPAGLIGQCPSRIARVGAVLHEHHSTKQEHVKSSPALGKPFGITKACNIGPGEARTSHWHESTYVTTRACGGEHNRGTSKATAERLPGRKR